METTAMCSGPHPFIPCPGVAKFTLQYTSGTDIMENILNVHHVDGSGWSDAQLSAMASTIATAWGANVAAQASTNIELSNVRATDLSSHTAPSILNTYAAFGSDATTMLPQGTTLAVKLTTDKRGRSYRGRIFHPGLTDHRLNTDTLTSVYASAIVNAWRAVRTAINAVANCELGVLSLCQNGSWLGTGVFTPSLNFDLADQYIDYQRRRSAGHARHH